MLYRNIRSIWLEKSARPSKISEMKNLQPQAMPLCVRSR